jgi:hypothetical protein
LGASTFSMGFGSGLGSGGFSATGGAGFGSCGLAASGDGGTAAADGETGAGFGGSGFGSGFAIGVSTSGISGLASGRGWLGLGRLARVSGAIVTSWTASGISSGTGGSNNLGRPTIKRVPRTTWSATDNAALRVDMPPGNSSGTAARCAGTGSAIAKLIGAKRAARLSA